MGQVTIQQENCNYYEIIIEATQKSGVFGNIAIDDVKYFPGYTCEYLNSTTTSTTTPAQSEPFKLQCDFQESFCDWTADSPWTRQTGLNAKYGSAPLSDFNLQNSEGYYAYFGSSYEGQEKTASMKSKLISQLPTDICFEFWYQLSGRINTSLTVILNSQSENISLWQRNGFIADTWTHAYVNIKTNSTENYSIQILGSNKIIK
jgi:hypothetical protein